jgi:hypothetical protein
MMPDPPGASQITPSVPQSIPSQHENSAVRTQLSESFEILDSLARIASPVRKAKVRAFARTTHAPVAIIMGLGAAAPA